MWHPRRFLRAGRERVRPISSAILAVPAAVGAWVRRHIGRPLRRGFSAALDIVAPLMDKIADARDWLGRRIARQVRKTGRLISGMTSPVSGTAPSVDHRRTRPLRRILKWVSRNIAPLAAPVRAFFAGLGHGLGRFFWRGFDLLHPFLGRFQDFNEALGNRFRHARKWFARILGAVFRPVQVLWQAVGRSLGETFRRLFWRGFDFLRHLVLRVRYLYEDFFEIAVPWLQHRLGRLAQINPKILGVAGVLVVLFALLGYWQGRPLYHKFKERRFLGLAREFMQQGKGLNAAICARNILAYNPKNVEASEILADLADRSKSPQAMIWRQRVVELDPSPGNRIKLADCALRYEPAPFPLVAKTLEELPDKEALPFHLLSARFAIQLNQLPKAEAHFEAAIRLEPTNTLHQLNLAVLRLQSTNSARASSARATLENLRTHAGVDLDALRWLIGDSLSRKDLTSARQLADELLANPRSVFSDRLLHLSLLHQMQSGVLAPALQTMQTHWATNAPQATEIANWMIARGQAREALPWLQRLPAPLRSSQPVPLTIATCFQVLEDWPGLRGFLEPLDWGEQDFMRQALMARALRKLGETAVADSYWQRASRTALERPEFTALLAQTTRSWGWNLEAEQMLTTLSTRYAAQPWALPYVFQQYHAMGNTQGLFRVFSTVLNSRSPDADARETESLLAALRTRFGTEPWALWVMRHLFDYYLSTGNTRGIYRSLSTAMDRGADDVALKNNFATVAMLLQTNLPTAHTLARQVYEREPGNASVVSTYAYSLHLQGQTSEALKLMQGLNPQDLNKPSIAVYYGFLLAAGGETLKASDYLTTAGGGALLPEEKDLVALARRMSPPNKP